MNVIGLLDLQCNTRAVVAEGPLGILSVVWPAAGEDLLSMVAGEIGMWMKGPHDPGAWQEERGGG